jgi:co-chaperonin GroES (HSP10)
MLDLNPVGNIIIVEQKLDEKVSKIEKDGTILKSGICLPGDPTKDGSLELFEGKVLRIGAAVTRVNVGDDVVFSPSSFRAIKREGKEYLVMRDGDVICTVSKKGTN